MLIANAVIFSAISFQINQIHPFPFSFEFILVYASLIHFMPYWQF